MATQTLADCNEEAEEAFLCDELLSELRAKTILQQEIAACRAVPVLYGSAKFGIGIRELADALTTYMPSCENRKTENLHHSDGTS